MILVSLLNYEYASQKRLIEYYLLLIKIIVYFLTSDIDECSDKSTNECHSKAVCTNTQGSYTCKCFNGFSGNGSDCEGEVNCYVAISRKISSKYRLHR